MLTTSQLRVRTVQGKLRPKWIDPADPELLDLAEQLVEIGAVALDEGWSRGQLEAELLEATAVRDDRKLADGLAKLLTDRVTFTSEGALPPVELRAEAFRLAVARGPLALEAGPLGRPTADVILAEVAAGRGVDVEAVRAALFADLHDAHRVVAVEPVTASELLDRYNVSLVQSLLLSATEVRLTLADPSPARVRQLLRKARFHQLICSAERDKASLRLTVDGPVSLFTQSTRYGLQLASFFPAIVLQDAAWELEATILWTPRRLRKELLVRSADGLRTHARDDGGYTTREQGWFEERFAAADTPWTLEHGHRPIDLGGRAVVMPDYTLRRGDREVHLEILGYWRPEYLERRLDLLRRYGPGNVILAVSRKLCGDERPREGWGPEVLEFAQIVAPKSVIELAERLALPAQDGPGATRS